MKIYDIIWGKVEIKDKDISRIIKHSSIQRLKQIWISTYGYLFNLIRNSTRYDHSVGVYLLLKKFGASKNEQIAGLVHDVSHTAFSHLSTYAMLGKYSGDEFHDMIQDKFIKESGLSDLLKKLGFRSEIIEDKEKFKLLENNLPDICADRIDYAIRDGLHLQILSRQQADKIINGLVVYKGEFIFNNIDSAFIYSFNFYLLNLMFYGSASEAHFNNDFGGLIKFAIKRGVLKEKDWFTNDVYVVDLLKKSKDTKIQKWLGKYNNRMIVYEDRQNPDVIFPKKIRIVDPKILIGKNLKRLTQVSLAYKKLVDDYQKDHTKHELPIKLIYKD